MQNQQPVQELKVSLEELKDKIALADALDALHRSPNFKKVILSEYIENKPKQLVKLMALPQNDMQKELVKNSMVGISAIQQFFSAIYRDGDQAESDLAEYEAALAEERAGVADE